MPRPRRGEAPSSHPAEAFVLLGALPWSRFPDPCTYQLPGGAGTLFLALPTSVALRASCSVLRSAPGRRRFREPALPFASPKIGAVPSGHPVRCRPGEAQIAPSNSGGQEGSAISGGCPQTFSGIPRIDLVCRQAVPSVVHRRGRRRGQLTVELGDEIARRTEQRVPLFEDLLRPGFAFDLRHASTHTRAADGRNEARRKHRRFPRAGPIPGDRLVSELVPSPTPLSRPPANT